MAPNINSQDVLAEIAAIRPHVLLSFQAPQILKAALLAIPTMGALNLHFGLLPRYRGVAPIAWALINGETATGVTLHRIAGGIDDGPIISSKRVPIRPEDTGRTVYDRCAEAGIQLFRESWQRLRHKIPPGTTQSEHDALYYNRHSIDFSRRSVMWHSDCEDIANWIRAMIFPPFQFPLVTVENTQLEVDSVRWDRLPHRGRPGEILAILGDEITVGAPGGRLTLGFTHHGAHLGPSEFIRLGVTVGAVLT